MTLLHVVSELVDLQFESMGNVVFFTFPKLVLGRTEGFHTVSRKSCTKTNLMSN